MSKSTIECDGIEYDVYVWDKPKRHLDIYQGNHKLACAWFDDNTENALIDYYDEDGGTIDTSSNASFYFENINKELNVLVNDVGRYLASTYPGV